MEQAGAAVPVGEQDQILPQDANVSGDIGGICGEPHRMPVTSQKLAHRRAAADRGQLSTGGGLLQGIGGAEIAVPLGDGHRFLRTCVVIQPLLLFFASPKLASARKTVNAVAWTFASRGTLADEGQKPTRRTSKTVKIACLAPPVALR
jgi:hypothetical protein